MVKDRLLTELERQEKYLAELPESFEFPLFNSAKALESQRRSAYRTTAAAAREIVDNAVEAGASSVHVVFERLKEARRKHQRKDSITAVAFIDNGSGMFPRMARYALSWGGGTHFDEPDFIGKFGFGLPNASINQTRRVEVYTRTKKGGPITKAWLDINDYRGFGTQVIPSPIESELPEFVVSYLKRSGIAFDHGTIVVWIRPDRLSYNSAGRLKEHLVDDFGVTYRYLLDNFELLVEGVRVQAVDPLFLDPKGRFYVPPVADATNAGGAQLVKELALPVKYWEDEDTGSRHLSLVASPEDLQDQRMLKQGVIHLRVARLPLGFAAGRAGERGIPPQDEHSAHRFEIRKPRRGMSFVRANREIDTLGVFPHREKDEAGGLGRWPLLQGYAYHWGVEAKFDPDLDEVFGIGNDKQTVRPIEDFWRALADAGIDAVLRRENAWQRKVRKAQEESQAADSLVSESMDPKPAELAARAADVALGSRSKVPSRDRKAVRDEAEKKAEEQATREGRPKKEVLEALEAMASKRPYRVDYVSVEHGPFYRPKWDLDTLVVEVNRSHPFFSVLYNRLVTVPGGRQAKEAIDLVLIALAKGELGENEATTEVYRAQRETLWSPFLASAMRDLGRQFENTGIEEEVGQDDDADLDADAA